METLTIREQINQYIDQLPPEKLPVVADFLGYLTSKESDEAKKELLQIIEVEGTDEVISQAEIIESEQAWQNYIAGKDKGISSSELKKKLLLNQDD